MIFFLFLAWHGTPLYYSESQNDRGHKDLSYEKGSANYYLYIFFKLEKIKSQIGASEVCESHWNEWENACTSEGKVWPEQGNLTETNCSAKTSEMIKAPAILESVSATERESRKQSKGWPKYKGNWGRMSLHVLPLRKWITESRKNTVNIRS